MKIAVLAKQVPDLVEGLEIGPSGKALEPESLRYILSETDDHALEEALLIKERTGGRVEVFSLELGEVRDALFTALAKGADRAALVHTDGEVPLDNHALGRVFADLLRGLSFDLILTGVRAIDDLDGSLGGLVAGFLNLPYVGLVRKVEVVSGGGSAILEKEYPGGFAAELEVKLPAVLGIQAAEQPPRYVPISRLRQVMKTTKLEELAARAPVPRPLALERMFMPEEGGGATMLSGTAEEMARQIANLLSERRVLR
jgi:electron transfer flavoprotein beta subunit